MFEGIINFIFGKKKISHINLDSESLKNHHKIRAIANENAELKGRLAKYQSEEGKGRESEKDKQEEENVRIELDEQKQELQKKSYPQYFSLKKFFNKTRNTKYKDLGYYSFDRAKKLASFGDIGFSSDGDFVLLSKEGEVLMKMKNLHDIFQSVAGLGNDVKTMKIPLNVDKEGNYVENIMVWQPPEVVPIGGGKFQYASARKRPFYEYLNELRGEITELQIEIEEKEITNTELQKEIDMLKVSQRVAEDSSETSRKEISEIEGETSAIKKIYRATATELSKLRDVNVILEENLNKLESEFEKMRDEAERQGVKLSDDVAMEKIQQIRRELVRDEPEKVQVVEKIVENPQNPKK